MEMHQLRYFLAATRALSFTRAAEACHVSQPALTSAIKKLEAELGGPLFFRESNRLKVSDFGRQMQPLLAQIVERAEAAQNAAENFRLIHQQPIRLGVMPTLGPVRIARFLSGFERDYPGFEVAVREGRPAQLGEWLDADELDAAIVNPVEGIPEGWRVEPLYTERYVVILPPEHPLKSHDSLSLQDLSGQPYVDRLACEMRERVMTVCRDIGVELYARYRSEREDWVQAMVAANLGFAFIPEHSVVHPGAVQRPLADPAVERTIALVTMPGRPQSPAVQTFLRAVRRHRWLG
jgi:DNA-binding transcriptional LysR family regulator